MSLRYKALAAVLVLVTAVTGGLVAYVSWLYDGVERQDIRKELAVDAERFRDRVGTLRKELNGALQAAISSDSLSQFYDKAIAANPDRALKAQFDTRIDQWRRQSGADAGFAAMDPFLAEERKARVLHATEAFAIVGSAPDALAGDARDQFVSSPAVNNVLGQAFAGVRSVAEVVPVGDRLYLAVACPFFTDTSEFISFRRYEMLRDAPPGAAPGDREEMEKLRSNLAPEGAAVVLKELSGAWLGAGAMEAEGNPIHQVLYVDRTVAAASFRDAAYATATLEASRAAGNASFEVRLPDGTWIGHAGGFRGPAPDPSGTGFIATKNLDRELEPLALLIRNVSVGGLAFAFLGALAAYGLASLVIRRLGTLRDAADRVRAGDFNVSVDIRSRDEIGALGTAFNNMIKGLQALGLYTDTKLARNILDNSEIIGGASARHEGTVLFTDIKNFTGITESMDAGTLTEQLNEYFTALGDHVKKEEGYVDKFIGDAVMAFWGEPFLTTKDHAVRACRAALRCMQATADLRRYWKERGRPLFYQRIGLATGEVVVGNIGSATKKNFTVIGDSVNLASRLEGASKIYGTEILIDERTRELAGAAVVVREIDEITVRGKQKPVRVFELLGLATDTGTRARRILDGYGRALASYRANDFAGALAALAELAKTDPEDGPARWLWAKCQDALAGQGSPSPTPITRSFGGG